MPSDSWCFLAFIRRSAMLEDFSCCSASSSDTSLRPLLLLLDKFRGKMERGSVKDSGVVAEVGVRAERREEGGGGMPKRVLTSKELLKPDKKGDRLPPKAATTAAYCKMSLNMNI